MLLPISLSALNVGDIVYKKASRGFFGEQTEYQYIITKIGIYKNKSKLRRICLKNKCKINCETVTNIDIISLMSDYGIKYLFIGSDPQKLDNEDDRAYRPRKHEDWISLWASESEYWIIQKLVRKQNEIEI